MQKIYDKRINEWYYIDNFGNPYFYKDEKHKTERITITLPVYLIKLVDKKRGEKYSRSRYMRGMIEYTFNIKPDFTKYL